MLQVLQANDPRLRQTVQQPAKGIPNTRTGSPQITRPAIALQRPLPAEMTQPQRPFNQQQPQAGVTAWNLTHLANPNWVPDMSWLSPGNVPYTQAAHRTTDLHAPPVLAVPLQHPALQKLRTIQEVYNRLYQ